MKFSIYNSIIPLSEKSSLFYSASSDKFIVFKRELEPLLKKSPLYISETLPNFYEKLLQGGFLVSDELNEIENMIEFGMSKCNDSSTYHLIINPTLNCNFKCWYCYEDRSVYAKMNEQTVHKVEKFVTSICKQEFKEIHLSFFGGEPLLYYNDTVRPLIDTIRENRIEHNFYYNLHFTTNGFLITDYILRHLLENDEHKSFQITLDGNREQHNKVRFSTTGDGSYDRIIMNINKLLEHQIEVLLRINYTRENIKSVLSVLDDIGNISTESRKYLRVDFQKVWQDHMIEHDHQVLDETIEAFKKEFNDVSDYYHRMDNLNTPCYGDMINECVINYNGDIYKCTARDFKSSDRVGQLDNNGKIHWVDSDFPMKRLREKFNKKVCNRCRIFPLCGGGCVQTALESINSCINCKSETDKNKFILARFYDRIVKYQQKNESTTL